MCENLKKTLIQYISIFIIMIIVFSSAMVISYKLPNKNIRENIRESVDQLDREGQYLNLFFGQDSNITKLDNFTDSIMLMMAANNSDKSDFKNAFSNPFYNDNDQSYSYNLKQNVQEGIISNQEYSRYWNGIETILRPMLMMFNYMEIRYINAIIIFMLLFYTISNISKYLGKKYMITFGIAITCMGFYIIPMSLQYSSVFVISLIASNMTIFLYNKNKEKLIPYFFFIIGGVTSFFDMLTVPLITLGMPLIIAILLSEEKIIDNIYLIIKISILWIIGYVSVFLAKWVIASIVLNKNVITVAIEQIFFRMNLTEKNEVSRFDAITENLEIYFNSIAIGILFIYTVIFIINLIKNRNNIKECFRKIPLLVIACMPYMWYFVFANHSSIHAFFTFRLQAITMFAILSFMANSFELYNKNIKGE